VTNVIAVIAGAASGGTVDGGAPLPQAARSGKSAAKSGAQFMFFMFDSESSCD
jgi:hypothetical protein